MGGNRFHRDAWRYELWAERGACSRPPWGAGDDREFGPRSYRGLRFRSGAFAFGWQTPALWRPILRAFDPAHDRRADRSDQLRRALSGGYAVTSVGPVWSGRHSNRGLQKLPAARSLDVGTHGAHTSACRIGIAGFWCEG